MNCFAEGKMDTTLRVPHISIAIDENNLTAGALVVLDNIRPTWPKKDIKFKVFYLHLIELLISQ